MTETPSAPPIVHTPLPWYADLHQVTLVCALIGLVVGNSVFFVLVPNISWVFSMAFGMLIFMIFTASGPLYHRLRWRRTYRRQEADNPIDSTVITRSAELKEVVADLLPPVLVTREKHVAQRWHDFQSNCQRLGIPRPRTVLDSTLAERLGALDRPDIGMEPEPILGSGDPRGVLQWISPGFVLIGVALMMYREVWHAMSMFVAAGLWSFTSRPAVRDRLRIFRWDDGSMVAGMGSLRDARNRVWTTDNALMIVQTKDSAGGLFVRFVGDPGEAQLSFNHESDPDFLKLWQRWNHPTPRPELVEQ